MEEIKHHIASKNVYRFFTGLLICLTALVLLVNIGAPAHAINYPFLYLIGFGAMPLYLYFYLLGNFLMFKRKGIVVKKWNHILAIILLSIMSLMLASYITVKCGATYMIEGNVFTNMANVFKNVPGGYLSSKVINVFSIDVPFGGGVLGYLLVALTYKVGEALCLTIIIVLFLMSFVFIFGKKIFAFIKNKKTAKTEQEKEIKTEENDSDTNNEEIIEDEDYVPVEGDLAQSIAPSPITPLDFNQRNNFDRTPFSSVIESGVQFAKPEFKNKSITPILPTFGEEESVRSEDINTTVFAESVSDSFKEPVKEKNEQLELDFNAKPEINEEIALQKTEFAEPVVANEVKEVETPKMEVKPKEKIVWIPPSPDLLNVYETSKENDSNRAAAEERLLVINDIFESFGIGAKCDGYTVGSSVTRYHIRYGSNVSIRQVSNIVQDISLRLGGLFARFENVVEGQTYSGLEIPNVLTTTVGFKEVFETLPDVKKHPMAVGFGKDISGKVISADLDEFPHLLVAGTTGSGKSIYVHSIIATLIMRMSPDELRIALVDPKKVEMSKYRDMPHLLCPIITDANKAKVMLSKLCVEMEKRYEQFDEAESSSNIKQYNEWAEENKREKMPYIVVFVDEYADLVDTCKEISQPVVSIAQKARAAGIHLVISTQRPSTNVITGVIKGNLPTRVALMTASAVDSVTILGEGGAETLLGKGDMLVSSPLVSRVGMVRLQGCYIQNKEINRIVGYLKEHYPTNYDPDYMDLVDHAKEAGNQMVITGAVDVKMDEATEMKYQAVKEWVMCQEYMSMSKIQRECGVGFNRAGLFYKRLVQEGVVDSTDEGNRGGKVLVHDKFSSFGDEVNSSEQIRDPDSNGY